MNWPSGQIYGDTRSWPINPSSLDVLVQGLLADGDTDRLSYFVQLFSDDADAFAWAVALTENTRTPINSPAMAGAWLVRDWQTALVWGEREHCGWLPTFLARLRRQTELEHDFAMALQAAKLESLKEFAYGAGHELNNPLANIATRAQTLLKDESHPERKRRLAAINAQAFRAHEMIADLMLFARPPKLVIEPIDLNEFLIKIAADTAERATAQFTEITCAPATSWLKIRGDRTQLNVAVQAVIINSLEALGRNGRIELVVNDERPGFATLLIRDNGSGIPAEIADKIFDPYFSGREAGRGLGFGLCKAWRIITQHGGIIRLESPPNSGTTATIQLPLPAAE